MGRGDEGRIKVYFPYRAPAQGTAADGSGPHAVKLSEEQSQLLKSKLEELKLEHRDLDDVIARVSEEAPFDQIRVQRLKKRKLMLRDEIARIESMLLPDIIA
jgi:hypothetical protein